MRLAFYGARVVDPFTGEDRVRDLFVEDDQIVESLSGAADREIQAQGKVLAPALLDIHCHLRDPGYLYKEDLVSGTKAAAHGGFAAVAAMPNTRPVCDNVETISYILDKAKREGFAEVYPIAAASVGLGSDQLTDLPSLKAAGARAVTDDGRPILTAEVLRESLRRAKALDLKLMDHCEDLSLSQGAAMNEGPASVAMGVKGMPNACEDIIVARDLILAAEEMAEIHITHASTRGAVELIRKAKARGQAVTADSCPHYFALTDEAVLSRGSLAKMYPPLRSEADRRAIIEAVKDGTIDTLSTDHAPHSVEEKSRDFAACPNGIIGLETAFPLSYTILCCREKMPLLDLLARWTCGPLAFLKLPERPLKPGHEASLVLLDLDNEYTVSAETFYSKAKNSPFIGWRLKGWPQLTLLKGRLTYEAC